MRDDDVLAEFAPARRIYDPGAPLDKALPEEIAAYGLKRLGDDTGETRLRCRIVNDLGLCAHALDAARNAAARNGTDEDRELVAAGHVTEERLAGAIARALGIPHEALSDADAVLRPPGATPEDETAIRQGPARVLRTCSHGLEPKLFIAPRLGDADAVARLLYAHPGERAKVRVAAPGAIGRHKARASARQRANAARHSLSVETPALSARFVLTGGQGVAAAMLCMLLLAMAATHPVRTLLLLHLLGIPLFLGCVWQRFAAALWRPPSRDISSPIAGASGPEGPRPIYSVLVALHHEVAVVPQLVAALAALRWPRSRIEVMLLCEGDDAETIAAVSRAIEGLPGFELITVPPSLPRTKPKALNFALPLARGDFVVLYDAEDKPRPDQLEAAWQRFASSGPELACLQAPLVISNGDRHWLAGHFALEYAALFRGFLPFLARAGLPLPLGGTSNHFRRAALLDVGGWDSHNVTEDADLGMRLYRRGYQIGTIDVPTFEEAPERFRIWRNQRTRWMKGWMQSWLVHMRDPLQLYRDLGYRGFVAFQLLFFGLVASTLVHPFFLGFLAYTGWTAITGAVPDLAVGLIIVADLCNVAFAYLAFSLLATRSLDEAERRVLPRHLWSLYAYWLLLSLAAIRALVQLVHRPHVWEKTPHGAAAMAKTARPASQAQAPPEAAENPPVFEATSPA